MEYITASCVISDNLVSLNGLAVPIPTPAGPTSLPASSAPTSLPAGSAPTSSPAGSAPLSPDPAGFLLSAYQHFGFQYPKFYKMDHLSKLGWLAAELLLSKGFDPGNYQPEDIAVVLSNSNASLDTDYKYMETVKEIPSPAVFVYTLPNIMIGEICIRHKFKGENAFFVFESFDAGFIHEYVRDLMEHGTARACICGWVDVLGTEYKAVLFLVEKVVSSVPFDPISMNRIAQTLNV
jgi:hypothetical protein